MAYQVLAEIGTVQFIGGIFLPTKVTEKFLLFSHTLISRPTANCQLNPYSPAFDHRDTRLLEGRC
jgi:hypothetical protein